MLNKVILMGRLVADPELKHTGSGIAVVSVRVAVERDYKSQGQEQRQSDFIDVVCWRNTAEFISRYFRKGQMVALCGSLQTRQYEDKNGNKRTAVEVVADNVYFADSKRDGASSPASDRSADFSPEPFSQVGGDDFKEIDGDVELPF